MLAAKPNMKIGLGIILAGTLILGGCEDAGQERQMDQQTVARSGVPSAVDQKMRRGVALNVDDIIALSQAHVPDGVVKRYMDQHGTIYHLTKTDADRLHRGGVSFDLIRYMDDTVTGHWPYPKAGHYLAPFGRGI